MIRSLKQTAKESKQAYDSELCDSHPALAYWTKNADILSTLAEATEGQHIDHNCKF